VRRVFDFCNTHRLLEVSKPKFKKKMRIKEPPVLSASKLQQIVRFHEKKICKDLGSFLGNYST